MTNIILQLAITGILTGIIYSLMALGLSLVFGVLRVINFAHGEFVMIAMYGNYFLFTFIGFDPYISALFLVPLFFIIGISLYQGIFRHLLDAPEESQIIATFGMTFIFRYGATLFWSSRYRSVVTSYADKTVALGGITIDYPHILSTLTTATLLIAIFLFLYYTNTGRVIRAVSEQRKGALLVGINVNRIYKIALGLGLACVALSGTTLMTFESAHPSVGVYFTLLCFVIVVLGGLGSLWGTLLGAIIIAEMEMFVGFFFKPVLTTFSYFIVFLAILMFRPTGLLGYRERRS
jgi:branched-chain amino acid transport system permease protein